MSPFRVLIFASAEPHRVKQLLKHLVDALPEAKLSLLYENPRRSLGGGEPGATSSEVRLEAKSQPIR